MILPFVAGCAVGILTFSRLLNWLLNRWHDTMLASLIGLLIGSLYRIWPYQHIVEKVVRHKARPVSATPYWPESFDVSLFGLFLLGAVFVVGIEWYARRRGHSVGAETEKGAAA